MRFKIYPTYCLVLVTIILTNLTQIPDLIDNRGAKLLSYLPWIFLAFLTVFFSLRSGKFYLGSQRYLYIYVCVILVVCSLLEISGSNGFEVSLLRPLLMCIFVYVISINIAKYIDNTKLNNMLFSYSFSGVIVTLFVYRTIVNNGFSWTSSFYAYNSKNSVSQIILTVIFFLIYLHGKMRKIIDILIDILLVLLTITLCMLRSRASLLGLVVIFISVLISKSYSRSIKIIIISTIVVFFAVIIVDENFRHFFLDSIIFAGRDSSNLNSISSGRVDMIMEFPKLLSEKPFLGYGRYYVESMPLDALIETGILGGIFFNIIAIAPIIYSIKSYKKFHQPIDYLLFIVGVCYYINGLFEQLAPFGPGVKCYMLWMLFGFSVAWKGKYRYEDTVDYKYADNI